MSVSAGTGESLKGNVGMREDLRAPFGSGLPAEHQGSF